MIARVAASYWTVLAVGIGLLALHVWWFHVSDHQTDVVSGGGAALGVLGVWIAACPYIRRGFDALVARELPAPNPGFYASASFATDVARDQEVARPSALRDVISERIAGVGIAVVGALLNGYASAIARLLGLRDIAS